MELFQEAALSMPAAPILGETSGLHNELLNRGEESNLLETLQNDDIDLLYTHDAVPVYHWVGP